MRHSPRCGLRPGPVAVLLVALSLGPAGPGPAQVRPLVLEDPGRSRPLPTPPLFPPRQATLEEVWESEVDGVLLDGLVAGAGGIVFGLLDGRVGAVDAADGHLLWQRHMEGLAWAPRGLNRLLFAGGGSRVTAFSPEDGQVVWSRGLAAPLVAPPQPGPGSTTAGTARPPMVLALLENGELVALEARRGEERWRAQLECRAAHPPAIATDLLVVACEDGTLAALSPTDGARLWRRRMPGRPLTPPLADEARVLVGLDSRGVLAVGREDGKGRYFAPLTGQPSSPLALHGGVVLVGAQDNLLYAIRLHLGHLAWSIDAQARVLSGPATLGDVLALSPRQGSSLVVADSRDGAVLSRTPLPGERRVSAGAPAFAGSLLVTASQPLAGGRGWLTAHRVTLEVLEDDPGMLYPTRPDR